MIQKARSCSLLRQYFAIDSSTIFTTLLASLLEDGTPSVECRACLRLSNSDCLYLTVSAFHSAPDLAIANLIDSVTTDPVLLSAVQPTEASILRMNRCCFCLSLYTF